MEQPPGDGARAGQFPSSPPFPSHAGLDDLDPWTPAAAPQPLHSVWPWGLAQLSELLEVVALAILMFLAVRAVGQNFIVDGDSMFPTFEDNQLLVVNRLAYVSVDLSWIPGVDTTDWRPFGEPQPGDVVVFLYPGDESRDFIKRVIARGGQTVSIQNGIVFVDGVALDEPYIVQPCDRRVPAADCQPNELTDPWQGDFPEQTVPEGMLFVMGDNRENSSDSRSWGMLPETNVLGRADLRYWPFDQIGLVQHHHPEPGVTAELSAVR